MVSVKEEGLIARVSELAEEKSLAHEITGEGAPQPGELVPGLAIVDGLSRVGQLGQLGQYRAVAEVAPWLSHLHVSLRNPLPLCPSDSTDERLLPLAMASFSIAYYRYVGIIIIITLLLIWPLLAPRFIVAPRCRMTSWRIWPGLGLPPATFGAFPHSTPFVSGITVHNMMAS